MDFFTCNFGVEVPLFLFFFAAMLADPVTKNFVIFRTCYVILGYNETDCAELGSANQTNATAEIEKSVEPDANVILMSSQLVCQIVPAILCLFIGPWSDKNGRRPVLLITVTGLLLAQLVKAVITMIPNSSPWLLLLEGIPVVLSGGFSTFIMVTLCYVTDVSTSETRGMRMAIFECVIALGMLLGTLSSSFVYSIVGYTGIYMTSTSCLFLALLFIYFLVSESVVNTSEIQNASIFSLVHLKEMIKTMLKHREDYKRTILLLSIVSLNLYAFAIMDGSVVFFYVREKFHWTLQQYTLYSSLGSVIWIVGTFVGVYILHKLLRISETKLLVLGFVLMAVGMLFQGVAQFGWQIYAACAIRGLGGVISPMLRSLVSKIVPADEIGKIFALTIALELFLGLISNPVFTLIYNETITTLPGAFSIFCAGIYVIEVVIVIAIIAVRRMQDTSLYNGLIVNEE